MKRLAYIDWLRGLACIIMFVTHCYDSWLRPELHDTWVYKLSQLIGTFPAPLFLFVAGIAVALVTERMREKGIARNAIARQTILRGAEIFGLGLLFRLQEYALGYKWVPWTDLLRVDILNILGVSIMLVSGLCWLCSAEPARARWNTTISAAGVAIAIALLTPQLWTSWRLRFLPWPLETYINGVHTFDSPQHWLFPMFPWCAFAFAGLATGCLIFSEFARDHETGFFISLGGAGAALVGLSAVLDALPIRLYRDYDYWHSSPNFLLARCGVLLIVLCLAYVWCRWGLAQKGFSPAIQLGQTSLLVYWVHIEFVYGRFSILPKHNSSIPLATLGLFVIFLAMLGLSVWRTRHNKKKTMALRTQASTAPEPAT